MAGGKLTFKGKLKASTILEVLISMIVIMVVFGIAMMIFTNVTRSSLSDKKLSAEKALNEQLLNDEKSAGLVTQTLTIDNFRVEQTVQPYNGDNSLTRIDLAAYDEGQQKIAELHKIIITINE